MKLSAFKLEYLHTFIKNSKWYFSCFSYKNFYFSAELIGFKALNPDHFLSTKIKSIYQFPLTNSTETIKDVQRGHFLRGVGDFGETFLYEPPSLELYTKFSLET